MSRAHYARYDERKRVAEWLRGSQVASGDCCARARTPTPPCQGNAGCNERPKTWQMISERGATVKMFGLDHAPPLRTFVQDPTIIFTALVLLAPLAFLHSIKAALTYLTTPMMLSSFGFLYIVLRLTHSSKCLLLSTRDQRVANWFLMNGVYFNLFLDVVSGQLQMMDAMSHQYGKIEPRYLLGVKHDGGQIVFMTTLLELFFQSPLCLVVYYGYHKGLANRRLCEIVVCTLHVTGVWYFYVPEIAVNFRHLGGPPISLQDALTLERIVQFWFAFWICGITWIVVPLCIGRTAWKQVCMAIAISKSPSPSSYSKID